jgi:branched-chain amino acid transport system substrate-binding protein
MRAHAIAILAGALSFAAVLPASAQDTIRIGELNSYKSQPAFLEPYKKGLDMAADEINKSGGVLGKKLEIVSRDDGGNPGDAVRVAEELAARFSPMSASPLPSSPARKRSSSSPPSR